MTDYHIARKNMVDNQIRPSDVTDRRILQAMLDIPREHFVPAESRGLSYIDIDLPVYRRPDGYVRYMMQPRVLARLLQAADISPTDLVLDIGCTTGYSAALLAKLADSVVGLEEDADLADRASKLLTELELDNAPVVSGPLTDGYPSEGPYDVIIIEGGVPFVPDQLLDQLHEGGRLLTVIQAPDSTIAPLPLPGRTVNTRPGKATLFQNINGAIARLTLFDATAMPLPGFAVKPEFVF